VSGQARVRVRFRGDLVATLEEDGTWSVPGSEDLQYVLNSATAELTRGPSYGFDPEWTVANVMAERQGGEVLDDPPPPHPQPAAAREQPVF
jgi:hypothetical protein